MNQVIAVMGADNIGKTYFVDDMMDKYPRAITHHWGAVKNKFEGKRNMVSVLDGVEKHSDKLYLFDRFPLGDFVYGPVFRDYDAYSYFDEIYKKLEKMKNTRMLLIFLYADVSTYDKFGFKQKGDEKKRYQKRGWSEKISVEFFKLANKLYGISHVSRILINCNNYDSLDDRNRYIEKHIEAFLENKLYKLKPVLDYSQIIFNPSQVVIDIKDGVFGDTSFSCKQYQNNKCLLAQQHRDFSPYGLKYDKPTSGYGNVTDPDFVFIAEAAGHLGCGTYGIPFYGDKSGYIFYKALQELGILHSQIYITNTVKCCPKGNDLQKFYNTDDRMGMDCVRQLDTELLAVAGKAKKVIALGNIAYRTLEQLKLFELNFVKIYHPAYYLRIGVPNRFISELRKVING
jgi:uracil-DNA glycosylase family 4